jgi:predicted nucleic acid-binding protein
LSYVSLDTSVLAEYIDAQGDYHEQALVVIRSVIDGHFTALVPHVVLAELYYVTSRIYEDLGFENSSVRAEKIVEWLYGSPNFTVTESSLELAIESGRIKKQFGLALPDSYVISSAKLFHGKAVFKKREAEMAKSMRKLSTSYEIVFLSEHQF